MSYKHLALLFFLLLLAAPAFAVRHLMTISEVFTGLGGDTSVQYIELRVISFGQDFTAGGVIRVRQADGSGLTTIFTFPTDTPTGLDDRILIATPNFEALSGITPDYTFSGGIPPDSGAIILFPNEASDALAYGNYTGPNEFGMSGLAPAIPPTGSLALQQKSTVGLAFPNDAVDYELAQNSPTNLNGETGTISLPTEPLEDLLVELESIATGLDAPVGMAVANDGTNRLFILEQTGAIRIIDTQNENQLLPTPFLDLSSQLVTLRPGFDERGVIGLAFHPNYSSNGLFYVFYSAPHPSPPPDDGSGNFFPTRSTISEFQVSGNPNVADPLSERILLTIDKLQFNHNGGQLAFGPDGFLYIGVGDGGGARDVGTDHNPTIGNGQDVNTVKGKILRIDVDQTQGMLEYAIPASNPFSGGGGAPEIHTIGLRNPFRFGFDDFGLGATGAFILPDVGQNLVEEINFVDSPGLNLGWRVREGTICFDPDDPLTPLPSCDTTGLTDPVAEYVHPPVSADVRGLAVIGGYVYRGAAQPNFHGIYLFGDFSTGFAGDDGQLFAMPFDDATAGSELLPISRVRIQGRGFFLGGVLNAIGRDENGELYVIGQEGIGFPNPPTGFVERIVNIRIVSLNTKTWQRYR